MAWCDDVQQPHIPKLPPKNIRQEHHCAALIPIFRFGDISRQSSDRFLGAFGRAFVDAAGEAAGAHAHVARHFVCFGVLSQYLVSVCSSILFERAEKMLLLSAARTQ
jgi:hypothetical protein